MNTEEIKKQLAAMYEQEKKAEFDKLVEIVTKDIDGRFDIRHDFNANGEKSTGTITLWIKGTLEFKTMEEYHPVCLMHVWSEQSWRELKQFIEIMSQPGDSDMEDMRVAGGY